MIGRNIRQLRLENENTQSELAAYLGVTPKTVSFYELGQRFPPHDIICKLADYFGVSTDYLLGRSQIRNPEEVLNTYISVNETANKYPSHTISSEKSQETESNLLAIFRLLDDSGKDDVYNYIYRKYKDQYKDSRYHD
jgi:transcriptional regulator with XRE-family HTH domain